MNKKEKMIAIAVLVFNFLATVFNITFALQTKTLFSLFIGMMSVAFLVYTIHTLNEMIKKQTKTEETK